MLVFQVGPHGGGELLAQRVKHEVGFDALLYLVGCAGDFPADVVGQSCEWFGGDEGDLGLEGR